MYTSACRKGNNPLTIYHFPQSGLCAYASTEEILRKGLKNSHLNLGKAEPVRVYSGDILRIDGQGKISRSEFNDEKLYYSGVIIHTPRLLLLMAP